jgi:hypothetical protein
MKLDFLSELAIHGEVDIKQSKVVAPQKKHVHRNGLPDGIF